MNRVTLMGNIVRDLEPRCTQSGKCVCQLTLAVKNDFKNAEGKYDSEFFNCEVWGKSAEILGNSGTGKGSRLLVEGRLKNETYEKDGVKRYATKVIVREFFFLDKKSVSSNTQNAPNTNKEGFESMGNPVAFDDSELPF